MHPYHGATAALTTKHGKELLIAPAFHALGINVEPVDFDTDSLGTFTGEIERVGNARDVVVKKALIGAKISSLRYAIASEGSYGPDAQMPLLNSGVELLAWVDTENGHTVVESIRTFEIQAHRKTLIAGENIADYLDAFAFPSHALIVKGGTQREPLIFRGLQDIRELEDAIVTCRRASQEVMIENDLRAHLNPTRQKAINELSNKLVDRLSRLCTRCGLPGWGVIDISRGAECSECGTLNPDYPSGEILGCLSCGARELDVGKIKTIDAAQCLLCNP